MCLPYAGWTVERWGAGDRAYCLSSISRSRHERLVEEFEQRNRERHMVI